jgi:hypothetical protein
MGGLSVGVARDTPSEHFVGVDRSLRLVVLSTMAAVVALAAYVFMCSEPAHWRDRLWNGAKRLT